MVPLYYIVLAFQVFVIGFLLLYNTLSLILFFTAALKIRRYVFRGTFENLDILYDHPHLPPISFILPAYNEENGIIESIKSLMNLRYPRYEIIIVNDGSQDGTFQRVKRYYHFEKILSSKTEELGTEGVLGVYAMPRSEFKDKSNINRIILVDKKNGGKADALNAGINEAEHPFVCSMDADSLMDPDALLIAMRVYLENPDRVVGVGGQVGIANGAKIEKGKVLSVQLPSKLVELFQVVEYARSFNVGRTALASFNSLIVLSGVFSIFRRDLLLKIGGYLTKNMKTPVGLRYCGAVDTVCEDMEIVVRLYHYMQDENIKGRVEYVPFPIAWTEVPSRFQDLFSQRNRWHRGLSESLWLHKRMLLNPFFGQIGLFAMPYQFFFEFLGPLIELIGYATLPIFFALGYLNWAYLGLFFLVAIAYGMLLSVMTLILGLLISTRYKTRHENYNIFFCGGLKDIFLLIPIALLSNIYYRQYLLLAQAKGFIDFIRGKKSWEKFKHKGFEH